MNSEVITREDLKNVFEALGAEVGSFTIETTPFTPQTGTNYDPYGNCYYQTYGRWVHVHIGVGGYPTNSNKTIFTLPAKIRPTSRVFGTGVGGNVNTFSAVEVQNTGAVSGYTNGTYIGADVYYLL